MLGVLIGFNVVMCALQGCLVALQLSTGKTGFAVFHAVAAGFFLGMATHALIAHKVRA